MVSRGRAVLGGARRPSPATTVAQDRISYLFIAHAASPRAFPAKFSSGQGSSDLRTQHSSSASIMAWVGGGTGKAGDVRLTT